jgi:hypothetical protein
MDCTPTGIVRLSESFPKIVRPPRRKAGRTTLNDMREADDPTVLAYVPVYRYRKFKVSLYRLASMFRTLKVTGLVRIFGLLTDLFRGFYQPFQGNAQLVHKFCLISQHSQSYHRAYRIY